MLRHSRRHQRDLIALDLAVQRATVRGVRKALWPFFRPSGRHRGKS